MLIKVEAVDRIFCAPLHTLVRNRQPCPSISLPSGAHKFERENIRRRKITFMGCAENCNYGVKAGIPELTIKLIKLSPHRPKFSKNIAPKLLTRKLRSGLRIFMVVPL